MHLLAGFVWYYVIVFLAAITVVVFIHEMGHYLVARRNGVKVEVFSIGFGPELFGWNARSGTRWRISALPVGGYVKMFGDADETSALAEDRPMSDAEKAVSFKHKRVFQRMAIVIAGPLANIAFTIIGLAVLYMALGQPIIDPVVGDVMPNSAAAQAGIKPGDRILAINGRSTERFDDIARLVRLEIGGPLTLIVQRGDERLTISAQPRVVERKNIFGDMEKVPLLGVQSDASHAHLVHHGPVSALGESLRETEGMVTSTFVAIGQMFTGTRGTEDLGGPIKIAKTVGDAAKLGVTSAIYITLLVSLNLGLFNLFPIPVLDGGHLLFYAIEAVLGRPLGERAQEYGFRIGLFLVLALMIFATGNDIASLLWSKIKILFS